MTQALKAIVLGIVVYIVAKELIDAMVEETVEVGDLLIVTLVPLAIAVGIVWAALASFLK